MAIKWSEKDVIAKFQEAIMKQGNQDVEAERLQKLRKVIERSKEAAR